MILFKGNLDVVFLLINLKIEHFNTFIYSISHCIAVLLFNNIVSHK
jgi:hypothetical protein